MEEEKKIRISNLTAFLMIGAALLFDALEFILTIFGIGLIINPFITIGKWVLFWMWLSLRDVKMFGKIKPLATSAITFLAGLVPAVNSFPEFTIGIGVLIILTQIEDGNFVLFDEKVQTAVKVVAKFTPQGKAVEQAIRIAKIGSEISSKNSTKNGTIS